MGTILLIILISLHPDSFLDGALVPQRNQLLSLLLFFAPFPSANIRALAEIAER
jgi:hypothetical protein